MIVAGACLIAALHAAALLPDTTVAPPMPLPDSSAAASAVADPLLPAPLAPRDTVVRRRLPKAVEVSDAYATRLRIHQIASYTTIPLFVAQSVAGNQLFQADKGGAERPGWARTMHGAGAAGLGALFTINTVTGVWNLWESRDVEEGRGRRLLHSVLMLASDAGFAWSGIKLAEDAKESPDGRDRHRRVAYISMGTALAGYGIMAFGNH